MKKSRKKAEEIKIDQKLPSFYSWIIFSIILLIYLIAGFSILKFYRYQINLDGISYISIARKYLKGDFRNVINGCWGPLFSWLLVPFLFFDIEALLATKLLNLFIGLATLMGILLLSYRFIRSKKIRIALIVSCVPFILYFAYHQITPDLLLLCILTYYFYLILDIKEYLYNKHSGILCGVLGAIAYFAKGYAFAFFIGHFLLLNIFYYLRAAASGGEKRLILRNLVSGFVCFFLLSSGWVGLLSVKYNKITFNTAGGLNYDMEGPETKGPYINYSGFLEPPNATAPSFWEDPSYSQYKSWSAFSSWGNFKHLLNLIKNNIRKAYRFFYALSIFFVITLIVYIFLCCFAFDKIDFYEVFFPLFTFLLFSAGYTLFHIEERYMWPNFILLVLMSWYLIDFLLKKIRLPKVRAYLLILLFIPIFSHFPVQRLIYRANADKWAYDLSRFLDTQLNIHGNIASNAQYHISAYLSYHLNSTYYGERKKEITPQGLHDELMKYDINYYFVWGDSEDKFHFLASYKEITKGAVRGLRIYSLKERK